MSDPILRPPTPEERAQRRAVGRVAGEVIGEQMARSIAEGLAVSLARSLVRLGHAGPWHLTEDGTVETAASVGERLQRFQEHSVLLNGFLVQLHNALDPEHPVGPDPEFVDPDNLVAAAVAAITEQRRRG